jgi:hypothetical protein
MLQWSPFLHKPLHNLPSLTISLLSSPKVKGKSKMAFDDDDVLLALLKKQKCGYTDLSSPFFDVEVAALSLTNFQHATPIRGPVL